MKLKEIMEAMNGNAKRRSRAKVTVGTSIGIIAGLVAGIMLAPKSGRKTRQDIKDRAENSADKVRSAARNTAILIKDEATSVNETFTEKANDFKTHLKHAKKASKVKSEKTRKRRKAQNLNCVS